MERGEGPLVGAAPRRACLRGEVRSPAGRPLPARGDLPPLASRQATRGLPLRSARGHASGRARGDLPPVKITDTAAIIARARAAEGDLPPDTRLFVDPFAHLFAGEIDESELAQTFGAVPFLREQVRIRTR